MSRTGVVTCSVGYSLHAPDFQRVMTPFDHRTGRFVPLSRLLGAALALLALDHTRRYLVADYTGTPPIGLFFTNLVTNPESRTPNPELRTELPAFACLVHPHAQAETRTRNQER